MAVEVRALTCHRIVEGHGLASPSSLTTYRVIRPFSSCLEVCINIRPGMGFDAIWISPIVTNTPNGYHGYWMQDLYGFNSNFGSKADLQKLIEDCHSRNMFIMLDVVGNHVGQVDTWVCISKSLVHFVAHKTLQRLCSNFSLQQPK